MTWVAGLAGVAAVILYFRPADFAGTLRAVGAGGVAGWLALTLAARGLLIETTVQPLAVLGYRLARVDAFWISWLRSFTNQVLPLAGLAVYVQQLRARTGSSWSELAAMSSPQLLLASTALGLVGVAASILGRASLAGVALPVFLAFAALVVATAVVAGNAAGVIDRLPRPVAERAQRLSGAFRKLAAHPGLPYRLVAFHCTAILLRGSRLWLLFACAGFGLDWRDALLLIAVSEATALVQLTPGGLGLREGAIVGGAVLIGLPAEAGAALALVDRLFIVASTTLFAAPALIALRRA